MKKENKRRIEQIFWFFVGVYIAFSIAILLGVYD